MAFILEAMTQNLCERVDRPGWGIVWAGLPYGKPMALAPLLPDLLSVITQKRKEEKRLLHLWIYSQAGVVSFDFINLSTYALYGRCFLRCHFFIYLHNNASSSHCFFSLPFSVMLLAWGSVSAILSTSFPFPVVMATRHLPKKQLLGCEPV